MKHILKNRLEQMRIRNKLIFTILPFVLVGFALILIVFISVFQAQIKPTLTQQTKANIKSSVNNLNTRINTITLQSDNLLYNTDSGIQQAILTLSKQMEKDEYTQTYTTIWEALNDFRPFEGDVYNSMIRRALILTAQGEIVSRDSFYASTKSILNKIIDRVQEPAIALHGKLYLHYDPDNPNSLYLARAVYEWKGTVSFSRLDTSIGLWVMEMEMRAFTQLLDDSDNPVIHYALISDEDGTIFSNADVTTALNDMQTGDHFTDDGLTYRVYRDDLDITNLYLLSLVNETLLYNDIQNTFYQWILIIALCLLLVLAAIIVASSSLSKQFDSFITKIQSTSQAGESALIPVTTHDEFGTLAQVYNDMMLRISLLHEQVVMKELLVKKAELRSFQAQINPHFLYNTLDCINGLVALGKTQETKQTVTALGNIMRMSIKGPDFITVKQEVNFIQQYLYIQRMRYQERILFLLDIPDYMLDYQIPKLVIQPLLENAITHGISEILDQGMVSITGHEQADALTFQIKDNGVGMPEEMMQRINEQSFELSEEMAHSSIGIINIQSRLFLLYGKEYGIHITPIAKGGTCITVRLPKEKKENENLDRR